MVRRAGIGATTASAIIFTIILVSDFGVYFASQARDRSLIQANDADLFYDSAQAFEYTAATNALLGMQAFIASGPLQCGRALEGAAAEAQSLAELDHEGSTVLSMSPELASGGPGIDNLTAVAPFNGQFVGGLGMALTFRFSGNDSGSGVYYARSETHFVFLPVRVAGADEVCQEAISSIGAALGASIAANCTAPSIEPLFAEAAYPQEAAASRDGFVMAIDFQLVASGPCAVTYVVSLFEVGIAGPAGIFTMELEGGGRSDIALSPP